VRGASTPAETGRSVEELLDARAEAGARFFAAEAERLALLCRATAERFAAGGRLLALGSTAQERSDAHHVAVEFVHPVIVGKRALPALALTGGEDELRAQVELLSGPDDVVLGFSDRAAGAIGAAARRGCLTVAFAPAGGEWELVPEAEDPFVRQELVETAYHVLWELVHVFLEHAGRSGAGGGSSSFLYPFLDEARSAGDATLEDVRRSVLMKARDAAALREQTLRDGADALAGAAVAVRRALDAGGTVLAFGNGGSATDAADLVADLLAPPRAWPARAALDLTADSAILTALANDVGAGVLFARQVGAYGREGDVAVALSTSGGSANVVDALAEARRRGLTTVAFVGYGGGGIAAEGLADHVVVTRGEHVPRIQEAQASAYHVLRELVETVAADSARGGA
jgi:D-sedoheptulose 7-phosphate isomerase